MSGEIPWQMYEVPGSTRATVVTKPSVIAALLKKAASPVIIVGHGAEQGPGVSGNPVEIVIRLAGAGMIPVITTPSSAPAFRKRGFSPSQVLSSMEIGARLNDPEWSPGRDRRHPDLVLFIGFSYSTGWLLQSGLKSFAPKGMRSISIDQRYQPHCTLSFPNLGRDEWIAQLNAIADEVEKP